MFIPNFVKIGKQVQKLKWGAKGASRQGDDLVSLLFSVGKGTTKLSEELYFWKYVEHKNPYAMSVKRHT
jgi:hypothetical protein